jgi:hypothetical protein
MKLLRLFAFLFGLLSCETDINLIAVPKDNLLHANGSKVWLIDKIVNADKNFSSSKMEEKNILVFYNTYNCLMLPISSMGTKDGKRGSFELSSGNDQLILHFKNENWIFKVRELNALQIILEPTSNSSFPYELHLKTFPEI